MSLDASPTWSRTPDIAERGDDPGVTNDAGIGGTAWNLQETSPFFFMHRFPQIFPAETTEMAEVLGILKLCGI